MSSIPFTETSVETEIGFDLPVDLHFLDQANRIFAARIRRVSHALIELSCAESLSPGQRLVLSHEGHRIEVEVSSPVEGSTGVYLLGVREVSDEPGEVRSELRLPTDLSATLRVAGQSEQIVAKVVDMSPSGMGIEVPMYLRQGAKVCVNLEQGLAFGEIRFCRQKAVGVYLVGFKLEEYICQE